LKPDISIIVANYNNRQYLRECLDSILGQTYKSLEIIVADDCSSDDSPQIIREYQTNYPGIIKPIFSPKNRGVALTRHDAVLQASGTYITTLDSDDYLCDTRKLEMEMALIRQHREKNNRDIISYSNIVLVKADKTVIDICGKPKNLKEGNIFYEIITRTCMIPRDFVMKRDAYFEVGGYDYRFDIYEDWDLKIRLAANYEFYYSGINGIAYRRHGTGLSSIPIPKNIKWLKKVFKKNLHLVDKERKKEAVKAVRKFTGNMKENYRKRTR
jgi:glycosyltransferase involved in cell wall biosynthesis